MPTPSTPGEKRYIVALDATTGALVVGPRAAARSSGCTVRAANWLIAPPNHPFSARVQVRYAHSATPATVVPDSASGTTFTVTFAAAVDAVAPGQAAVVYDGDRVLGGGTIDHTVPYRSAQGGNAP